ncbi:MAG: phosphoglycerate kinase, partial [Pseudomonadota bacterium]|nr:phosphoglycerate kinase [Pseudomonadota bacterium]
KDSATVLWNGPCGVFEIEPFHLGTKAVAQAVAKAHAFTVLGGGDTLHAAEIFNVKGDIDYVSTGGGALLAFMEGQTLPAIEALSS